MADSNEPIVITGKEKIMAVRDMTRLIFWRGQARGVVQGGFRPRPGWTVKIFNQMYGLTGAQRVKTWEDIYHLTDVMIKEIQAEREASK